MRIGVLLATSMMIGVSMSQGARADTQTWSGSAMGAPRCELDCMICEALSDPAQYGEGAMKAMRTLTPGYDNWLFRSDVDLANRFGMAAAMEPEFARLMQAFAANGTQVVIAVQPTRGLMHRDKVRPERDQGFSAAQARESLGQYVQQLRRGGAIVPDILALVDRPLEQEYFFRRDHHWTPYGAKVTAEVVADAIKSLPVYPALAKKAYVTEPSRRIPKDGTLNRALAKICGNNYGFQYVPGFRTVPVSEDADALFGDDVEPEVVLVGTSNSAERNEDPKNYNFDGYLKAMVGVDILNYALPGAGEDGSLLHYLISQDYDPKAAPRLIIWELPANFSLSEPLTYRQLVPAVCGGCRGVGTTPSPLQATHTLTDTGTNQRVELLSNVGHERADLRNHDGFLELRISDKNIKDFYLITYYDNGARDKVRYRREAIVDGGVYFLELSRD
ncbi:MAG: hypothetical protein LPK85_11865, partial [Gammaproteobacteria bacterium]|nr:hypothetical protein [Gammaproteobacteria bacterium]